MTPQWRRAGELLSQAGEDRGVHQLYPDVTRRLSLIQAANEPDVASASREHVRGKQLSERLSALVVQAQTIEQIGNCPVVGITGLLNSGKSSLLAAYLSPAGRSRVLRGTANNQGTHRFVLWLPQIWWQQAELLQVLRSYVTKLFGAPPEDLATDPEEAFAQYNGEVRNAPEELLADHQRNASGSAAAPTAIDPLHVPLLAYDAALDKLGLALLDCPDIQTAFAVGHAGFSSPPSEQSDALETQRHRREQLARVGRLCSAFLIVSKLSALHDETLLAILETLRDTMPGVRRILAVNKVKARYSPAVVDEQARGLVQRFEIDEVYMAYDFRSHWAEHRLPPPPESLEWNPDDPLPIFFHGSATQPAGQSKLDASSPQAAAGMTPPAVERYLQDLSRLLTPGSLIVEGRRSVLDQLAAKTTETLTWFETNRTERERQLRHAWQAIADACFAFMAQRDASNQAVGLRLQTSPAIIAQMSDSLVRAAPWSMRPSLAIDRSVRQLQSSIAGGVARMRWLQTASAGVGQFLGRFRQGQTGKIVTADRFREQLERSDRHGVLSSVSPDLLTQACEHGLERFRREDTVRLDSQWLDQWSVELWKHMSLKRKLYVGMMPLAPIFGPLLAVTLIPFDAGGTAVLVFATTKELLVAAGIAALAIPTTLGGEVQDIVESGAALSQLSGLFAVMCDSLGLPRPDANQVPAIELLGQRRELSTSQLPVKLPAHPPLMHTWRLAPHFAQSLDSALAALRNEVEKQNAP